MDAQWPGWRAVGAVQPEASPTPSHNFIPQVASSVEMQAVCTSLSQPPTASRPSDLPIEPTQCAATPAKHRSSGTSPVATDPPSCCVRDCDFSCGSLHVVMATAELSRVAPTLQLTPSRRSTSFPELHQVRGLQAAPPELAAN